MSISILIADDHDLIHNGISDILKMDEKFKIVGHAYDGIEVVEKTSKLNPDIILMDVSMPKMNGIEATRKIIQQYPSSKIIVLSQHDKKEYISQMIQAGCSGYLLKNSRREEILNALEVVSNGMKYFNPELISKIMNENIKEAEEPCLTLREIEILKKIAEGNNNPEIADSLSISVRTVETHRRNLMQKLKVNTVVELLKCASKLKLIDF